MHWYAYIAVVAIIVQLLFLLHAIRNYRYALAKSDREHSSYRPGTVLIVPCKGLDEGFDRNITSFFRLDYTPYRLWFVVADPSDRAYDRLCTLKVDLQQTSKAEDVQIFVAGQATSGSQKLHNLLYCCNRAAGDVEIFAFADSDASVRPDWLNHLVWPLRHSKNGATSGYRWFIPIEDNLPSLALSAINAAAAQLLGNTRFNLPWGGSMAIRADDFRRLGLDAVWQTALSDDLSLSRAVKKAHMKVVFVPPCLVASYKSLTWRELFEFCRRQFLITRITAPGSWWAGLLSSAGSVLGFWGGLLLAIYAAAVRSPLIPLFAAVPVIFFLGQLTRAVLRQLMILRILSAEASRMVAAVMADVLGCWVWSVLLLLLILSSSVGRTIRWRGIRYKLLGPTKAVILDK